MADTDRIIDELKAIVGEQYVIHKPEDLIVYEYDGSVDKAMPTAVVVTGSTEEVSEVVKLSRRYNEPIVARDRAILELLYSSGLRLAELIDLDLGDVDLADQTVRVTGKGNKDRIVPVGRYARRAVNEWLKVRGEFARGEGKALFVSKQGNRLSSRSVQSRVSHWARRQGINTRVYPHLFRHSFATHLLESSHDLRGVQELLGHANISTTQVYTHLDFQHLAQIYDKTHPRARLKTDDKA